ncbi:hypothetical protein [Flavobacterium sp. HTF]|uniref:hypothetical protein n=1 Tax=Flavobacterium sp. HTF TaxID=2170732 RepID=UPI000D5C7B0B|nr:hypothetical protein [Flavobacterium sp. HTF]PWB28128.1 hypothetical protein DCO46_00855 [Flavobacterium sp. HTF]
MEFKAKTNQLPPALAGGYKKVAGRALAKLMHLAKALSFVYKNLRLKPEAIENQTLTKLSHSYQQSCPFDKGEIFAINSTKIVDFDYGISLHGLDSSQPDKSIFNLAF